MTKNIKWHWLWLMLCRFFSRIEMYFYRKHMNALKYYRRREKSLRDYPEFFSGRK